MKEKEKAMVPAVIDDSAPAFKGYTLEEIKYHRAMMGLRKEFCKAKMMQTVADISPKRKENNPNKSSKFALVSSVASKIFSNLNTLDYIMMGISLFGTVKKGFKLFRKKK